jgi:hypothetical protein
MKIFNFLNKITLTEIEKLKANLKTNPVCSTMSDLHESEQEEEVRIWLNPCNQKCFNYGYFTYQDFYDWIEGKGNIVKGNTDNEKQKYYEVAKFEQEHDYGWAIGYGKKYFSLIDDTFYTELKPGFGLERGCKNSLKITKNNHAEIIGKIFGAICRFYSDYEITHISNSRSRMHDELQGAKEALFALGIGYYGANNTPEEIENLNWAADLCIYKTAYNYFVKNNVYLPDFDFVYKDKNSN